MSESESLVQAVLESRSRDVRIELLRALSDLGGEGSTRDVRRRINRLRDRGAFFEEEVAAVNSRKTNYHLKGMVDDGLLERLEDTDESGHGSGALRFRVVAPEAVEEILSRVPSYDELRDQHQQHQELGADSPTLRVPADEDVDVEELADQLQTALPRVHIEVVEQSSSVGGEVDTDQLKQDLAGDLLALIAEIHTESEVREAQRNLR